MVKKAYSLETKLACIEMKKSGKQKKLLWIHLVLKIKARFIPGGVGTKKVRVIVSCSL